MNITRIVRVGYGYYPNPTRIKKKKKPNLSHRHSHSLYLSSVLAVILSLSLRALQFPPLLTIILSLYFSSPLLLYWFLGLTFWEGSVSCIYPKLLVLALIFCLILVPRLCESTGSSYHSLSSGK